MGEQGSRGEERQAAGKVGGQVDDQQEFERLGRLEIEAAAAQPQARPATQRVGAEDERQGGEEKAAGQPEVLVAAQEAQVGWQAQPQDEHPTADDQPERLTQPQTGVQPPDGQHAPAVEQGGQGQQVGVAIRQAAAKLEMGQRDQAGPDDESRPVAPAVIYDPGALAGGRGEGQDEGIQEKKNSRQFEQAGLDLVGQ